MSQSNDVVIVGTGEWARMVDEYFTHDSNYRVVAFCADREFLPGDTFAGRPTVALDEVHDVYSPRTHRAFVATSASQLNRLRARLYHEMKRRGYDLVNYVSTSAHVAPSARIGDNCLIAEMSVVQSFARIGNNVFLHSSNVIGHGTVVEDHCFVSSHVVVAAHCHIGEYSFLGVNSTFNDKTGVASDCVVASGSLVARRLPLPGRVYHGAPASAIEGLSSREVAL